MAGHFFPSLQHSDVNSPAPTSKPEGVLVGSVERRALQ